MNAFYKLLIIIGLLLITSYRSWACPITANFNLSSSELRIGDALLLTNTSSNATTYVWFINGTSVSSQQHYTHTFTTAGTYTIRLQANNFSCVPANVSITKTITVSNSNIGGTKVGLPVFPMAVIGNTKAQSIDWRYSLPQKDSIPNTLVNGGQTGAAFDGCGNIAFFVLHTGSANSNNLFVYRPDGTALLNNTVNAPGLNGVKGYQEIQVVPVPTIENEWYIIYKQWASDVGSPNSNAIYAATNWMYSRVRYVNNVFTVLSRDVALRDASNIAQLYTDGAAVSRTVPNTPNAHYLYLCRRSSGTSTTASVDRFIINSTGITFNQNSGTFTGLPTFSLALSYSPIELSPTEDKLAVITRNETVNDIDIILLNTANFTVAAAQTLSIDRMLLVPDGQTGDFSAINNNIATPTAISTSNSRLYFLRNIGRKVSDIEFSPNGKYLYFVGGGYQQSAYLNLTYLGQIDLTSSTVVNPSVYQMRLQIQTTPNNSYDAITGLGCNFQTTCINQSRQINAIESSFDGNLYFAKSQNSTLYVIPRPNENLPQNLIPSDIDLSTPQEPNHDLLAGQINTFPDQIDGYNYLSSDYVYLKGFFGKYNCRRECVQGGNWQLVDASNAANTISFSTNTCFEEVEFCVKKDKTYHFRDVAANRTYNNIVINGVLQHNAVSITGIKGYQVSLNQVCAEICGNGIDDDGDGLVDCLDGDCCGISSCYNLITSPCREDTTSCLVADCSATGGTICNLPVPVRGTLDFKTLSSAFVSELGQVVVGDIDKNNKVEMIAFAKSGIGYAFDGTTGAVKYTYNIGLAATGTIYDVHPILADVDNDGFSEIIISHNNRIVCFDYNGTIRWSSTMPLGFAATMGSIYDINQDGNPELIYANYILNARTGALLLQLPNTYTYGQTVGADANGLIAIGDVLPAYYCEYCNGLEFVAGNKVFAINITNTAGSAGNTYFLASEIANYTDGATSLVDIDADGLLDIIVASKSTITNDLGILAWNPRTTNAILPFYNIGTTYQSIGRVTSMNINSDTRLEHFFTANNAGNITLIALNHNFSASLWTRTWVGNVGATFVPGVTLYDLNNDTQLEVIYRDNNNLNILNAQTGNTLNTQPCASRGGINYPIVTNMPIYREGQIICTCREGGAVDDNAVVTVFKAFDTNNTWKRARKVWNQHAYNYVNINDDLTVPRYMTNAANYAMLNNFNVQQSNEPYGSTNNRLSILNDSYNNQTGQLTVYIDFCNNGKAKTKIPTTILLKPHLYPDILSAPTIDSASLRDYNNQLISILPNECQTFTLVFYYPYYYYNYNPYELVYGDYTEDCCCIPWAKSTTGSSGGGLLPLADIIFTAKKSLEHKKAAILDWQFLDGTVSNYNNIQIERSYNAIDFEVLATTVNPLDYTYTDRNVNNNIAYYRLLVSENNAPSFYTNIQAVTFEALENVISVFPNPFQNQVQVQIPNAIAGQDFSFEIYDLLGRKLQQEAYKATQGAQVFTLNMNENLAPANYILKVSIGQTQAQYFKLQKQD